MVAGGQYRFIIVSMVELLPGVSGAVEYGRIGVGRGSNTLHVFFRVTMLTLKNPARSRQMAGFFGGILFISTMIVGELISKLVLRVSSSHCYFTKALRHSMAEYGGIRDTIRFRLAR